MLAWWRHLYGGGTIWILAAWEDDLLRGIAPLFIHGQEQYEVSLAGSGVTDYLEFLVDDACRGEATQALCDHLCASRNLWSRCVFVDVPSGSSLLSASYGNCRVSFRSGPVCPYVALPDTMAAFEARLSPKFRHHLRNSWRRAVDHGIVFEAGASAKSEEYAGALIELHSARWQSRGEPGVLADLAMQQFFREVTATFETRGWLRWFGLRVDETLHAVACVFCTRRRYFFYLSGWDRELIRHGPGSLLIRWAIQHAISEGAVEFDFLRNGEPYKFRWGSAARANTEVLMGKESSPGAR